ncbi:MAG: potassium channel family protein, partial [Acidimicrobiales bacterium]
PDRKSDRFGIALVLITATIVSIPIGDVGGWGRVLTVGLAGGTLLFVLHTSQAHRVTMTVAYVAVGIGLTTSTVAVVAGTGRVAEAAPSLVGALLAIVAPVAIARRLLTHPAITGRTIAGALCLYLLVGVFFAFVFAVVGAIDPPFFSEEPSEETIDYVYFSFTTVTTTGYGDLTARGPAGRMLAVSEALIGQLYLVSVVALLVGNIGWQRQPKE